MLQSKQCGRSVEATTMTPIPETCFDTNVAQLFTTASSFTYLFDHVRPAVLWDALPVSGPSGDDNDSGGDDGGIIVDTRVQLSSSRSSYIRFKSN